MWYEGAVSAPHSDGPIACRSDLPACLPLARGHAIEIWRYSGAAMGYIVRQARTRDVQVIRALIDQNVGSGRLLDKPTVNLYEDIQEFCVAESSADGSIAGCGTLHVM